jgi:uncharacterized protein with PIN domain
MAEELSRDAREVELDRCPAKGCGGKLFRLGVTLGATKLKGCQKCRRVYWSEN